MLTNRWYALLLIPLVVACTASPPPDTGAREPPPTATAERSVAADPLARLVFLVRDPMGQPIPSAWLAQDWDTTPPELMLTSPVDAQGRYGLATTARVPAPGVAPSQLTMIITAPRYLPHTLTLALEPGTTVTHTIVLHPQTP